MCLNIDRVRIRPISMAITNEKSGHRIAVDDSTACTADKKRKTILPQRKSLRPSTRLEWSRCSQIDAGVLEPVCGWNRRLSREPALFGCQRLTRTRDTSFPNGASWSIRMHAIDGVPFGIGPFRILPAISFRGRWVHNRHPAAYAAGLSDAVGRRPLKCHLSFAP
jgi:hypothetical protein